MEEQPEPHEERGNVIHSVEVLLEPLILLVTHERFQPQQGHRLPFSTRAGIGNGPIL
jgi:hypothetical protein